MANTKIDNDILKLLATRTERECVSIYGHISTDPTQARKATLKVKSLLKIAHDYCRKNEKRFSKVIPKLSDAMDRAEQYALEHSQNSRLGFAVLISPSLFLQFSIHSKFADQVNVGSRFFLLPLIREFESNHPFYFLQLHPYSVALYRGDQFESEKLEVPNLPSSFHEMPYAHKHKIKSLQSHSMKSGSFSGSEFHGHGSDSGPSKSQYDRFVADVVKAVEDKLQSNEEIKTPIYISASDFLYSSFQKHWTPSTPKRLENYSSSEASHEQQMADSLIRSIREKEQNKHKIDDRFFENSSIWKEEKGTSQQTKDIIRNADFQNVDTLWINEGVLKKQIERTLNTHRVQDLDRAFEISLINQAVVKSFHQGAQLNFVGGKTWPLSAPMVAECRTKVL